MEMSETCLTGFGGEYKLDWQGRLIRVTPPRKTMGRVYRTRDGRTWRWVSAYGRDRTHFVEPCREHPGPADSDTKVANVTTIKEN